MATNLRQSEICLCATSSVRECQKKGKLTIQCDQLWSFVDNKDNKQWVWLALDVDTREIVGMYIGAWDETAAQGLWESFPGVYRQCAMAYTDLGYNNYWNKSITLARKLLQPLFKKIR